MRTFTQQQVEEFAREQITKFCPYEILHIPPFEYNDFVYFSKYGNIHKRHEKTKTENFKYSYRLFLNYDVKFGYSIIGAIYNLNNCTKTYKDKFDINTIKYYNEYIKNRS